MKHIVWFTSLLLMSLTACVGLNANVKENAIEVGVPTSQLVTRTSTAVVVNTPTRIASQTPTNIPEISPTQPPEEQSGPTIFHSSLQLIASVDGHPQWSPVVNEFAFLDCKDSWDIESGVYFAAAPEFQVAKLSDDGSVCWFEFYHPELIWHPEGDMLVWSSITLPTGSARLGEIILSNVRDQSKSTIAEGSARRVSFHGWLNETTLVYSYYKGGGATAARTHDIFSFKFRTINYYMKSGFGEVTDDYIPSIRYLGQSYPRSLYDCLLKKSPNNEGKIVYNECLSYNIEHPDWWAGDIYEEGIRFVTWDAEKEDALILVFRGVEIDALGFYSEIQLWDSDTLQAESIIPAGIMGDFSPENKFLAAVTLHPLLVDEQGLIEGVDELESKPSLYIMDFESRRIIHNLSVQPVQSSRDLASFGNEMSGPDWAWSPDGTQLIYENGDGFYVLLDLISGEETLLQHNNPGKLFGATWSYDGTYLSIYDEVSAETYIFEGP